MPLAFTVCAAMHCLQLEPVMSYNANNTYAATMYACKGLGALPNTKICGGGCRGEMYAYCVSADYCCLGCCVCTRTSCVRLL